MIGVLIREQKRRFDTDREEGHRKTEAETEAMIEAKEPQEPPGAGIRRKGVSPGAWGGMWPCYHLDFGDLA